MYATCISCHAPLGANEMLERFPVGRKLAIDAKRGRLWVVCGACRQWNLSPVEERWEAIEEGERLFRDARLRASTDQIGLARLKDGTELIRLGEPQRPEFAAWRYGDRFARRWMLNAPLAGVAGAAALVSKNVTILMLMQWAIVPLGLVFAGSTAREVIRFTRKAVDLPHPDAGRVKLTQAHVETMRILRDPDAPTGWHLRVAHSEWVNGRKSFGKGEAELVLHGADAVSVATRLMPRINRIGGRRKTVQEAVGILERAGSMDAVFRMAGDLDPGSEQTLRRQRPDQVVALFENEGSSLAKADGAVRLAVEMAAHEEQERALLAGELAGLEQQWKDAEEIAAIADSLTLPSSVVAGLERLRLR